MNGIKLKEKRSWQELKRIVEVVKRARYMKPGVCYTGNPGEFESFRCKVAYHLNCKKEHRAWKKNREERKKFWYSDNYAFGN